MAAVSVKRSIDGMYMQDFVFRYVSANRLLSFFQHRVHLLTGR